MSGRQPGDPFRFNPSRGGHAPAHLREAFADLVEMLRQDEELDSDTPVADPDYDDLADVDKVLCTAGELCDLLRKCTDETPDATHSDVVEIMNNWGCPDLGGPPVQTYAWGAGAIQAVLFSNDEDFGLYLDDHEGNDDL